MAAKSLTEAIHRAMCVGPMIEMEGRMRGELRDYFAHSVARFCKAQNKIEHYDLLCDFVNEVLKDIPPIHEGKIK